MGSLEKLVAAGKIAVLYTCTTKGEIKHNNVKDISASVMQDNRVLRKNLPVLNGDSIYKLKSLEENKVVSSVMDKLDLFIDNDCVEQSHLTPLDAENCWMIILIKIHLLGIENLRSLLRS